MAYRDWRDFGSNYRLQRRLLEAHFEYVFTTHKRLSQIVSLFKEKIESICLTSACFAHTF